MKLAKFIQKTTQNEFAKMVGVTQGMVHQWLSKKTPISPQKAVQIEEVTKGEVTRKDLRPDDWHLIWPELKD
jgi:DNA-binding transcriptional regulator YdaS (Cro superfamily)